MTRHTSATEVNCPAALVMSVVERTGHQGTGVTTDVNAMDMEPTSPA